MKPTLLLGLILVGGCQSEMPPTEPATVTPVEVDLEQDHSPWPMVTKEPYRVPFGSFADCRAPTKEEQLETATFPHGHGPHALHAIVVRINPEALEAFQQRQPVPVGTVIVKEKHIEKVTDKPHSIGYMIKREAGYDPKYGDWEYAYRVTNKEGKPELTRGKLTSCVDCHSYASDRDYLYRSYLPK
jgi:hypothetical protein